MLAQLQEKYKQLNGRERILVAVLGGLFVIFGFYSLIWKPLYSGLDAAEKGVKSQQQTLMWVKQNVAKVKQLQRSGGTANFSGSLTQLVNSSAKNYSLKIARMQPNNDQLQLWLEDAAFDSLLDWLNHLASKGVTIENLDLVNDDMPGVVRVRRLQLSK